MINIKIGDFILSKHTEPFIVAEVGINHNGDLQIALKMIEVAKQAGANAVKFQTFKAEEFIADSSQTYTYCSQGKEVTEPMLEMFRRYEFNEEQWYAIKKKCDRENIIFLSTPQNYSDLELLLRVGLDAIKIGSDDFNNLPLIRKYASTGLPLVLSSGMADLADVHYALEAAGFFAGYPVILLVCTSQYPAPPEDVNLSRLKTLNAAFPSLIIGFSDHTQGSLASSLAVGCGAIFFEKHFTLDHNLHGPDHWFSEDPLGLIKWVSDVYLAKKMLGSSLVLPTPKEIEMRKIARRSVVALKDINKGEELTISNLGLKRPGNGLQPILLERILGFKAACNISKNKVITFGDVSS